MQTNLLGANMVVKLNNSAISDIQVINRSITPISQGQLLFLTQNDNFSKRKKEQQYFIPLKVLPKMVQNNIVPHIKQQYSLKNGKLPQIYNKYFEQQYRLALKIMSKYYRKFFKKHYFLTFIQLLKDFNISRVQQSTVSILEDVSMGMLENFLQNTKNKQGYKVKKMASVLNNLVLRQKITAMTRIQLKVRNIRSYQITLAVITLKIICLEILRRQKQIIKILRNNLISINFKNSCKIQKNLKS